MVPKNCPVCEKEIPDYRKDDLYCDCGWQQHLPKAEFRWMRMLLLSLVVCFLQPFIMYVSHKLVEVINNFVLPLISQYFSNDVIVMYQLVSFLMLDFILLGILYISVGTFISEKTSNPYLITSIYAVIIVSFKILIVDPRCEIGYNYLMLFFNFLLFLLAIFSVMFSKYFFNKKALKVLLRKTFK